MTETITYSKQDVAIVNDLFNKMWGVVGFENHGVVMAAALAVALSTQYPNITPEQLGAGIKGASEWIAIYLSSLLDNEEVVN